MGTGSHPSSWQLSLLWSSFQNLVSSFCRGIICQSSLESDSISLI
jgi:hypothetical protein